METDDTESLSSAGLEENDLDAGQSPRRELVLANQVVITTALILLMTGMGCTMTIKDVLGNLRKPVCIFIGAGCQFILMPFLGWCMAHLFDLSPEMALGTLSIATCPGGAFSNILAYWTHGDTCLSVCMTTCSTVLGIGMMPLNLFIYSRSWAEAAAIIPYVDIAIALVIILCPCAFGMVINWKFPNVANWIAKISSVLSLLGIICVIGLIAAINPSVYLESWRPYMVAISYPLVAFGLGYIIPYCLRQPTTKCRTIAFETGVQNTALAMTIINLLFTKGFNVLDIMVIPALHGTTTVIEFVTLSLVYRWYVLRKNKAKLAKGKAAVEKKIQDWVWSPDSVPDDFSKFVYDNPALRENSDSRTSSLDRDDFLDDTSWPANYWDGQSAWGSSLTSANEQEPWKSAICYANSVRKSKSSYQQDQGIQTGRKANRTLEEESVVTNGNLGLSGWRGVISGIPEEDEESSWDSDSDDSCPVQRFHFTIAAVPPTETEL
ncbi:ileal sodium/bile acid cotransporter-like [Saccoglossus kowalevskii]|uniref:Ileal sodium/bile acid cotransporter-like n=1 Tax=Saccoglossus kowalevskii TaxID=10224 RepID=A0ABM0GW70_SACKO|nr:PREDICTED: ileal sodium/bile acid cotransporter-like [Saccoglossus kowalevskii]